jgi:hypothetical protein
MVFRIRTIGMAVAALALGNPAFSATFSSSCPQSSEITQAQG